MNIKIYILSTRNRNILYSKFSYNDSRVTNIFRYLFVSIYKSLVYFVKLRLIVIEIDIYIMFLLYKSVFHDLKSSIQMTLYITA